jgi:hypothetical protein
MNAPPQIPGTGAFDWRTFTKDVTLQGINAVADDPSEMKFRIMLARECGIIADDEATEMIRANKLEGA